MLCAIFKDRTTCLLLVCTMSTIHTKTIKLNTCIFKSLQVQRSNIAIRECRDTIRVLLFNTQHLILTKVCKCFQVCLFTTILSVCLLNSNVFRFFTNGLYSHIIQFFCHNSLILFCC